MENIKVNIDIEESNIGCLIVLDKKKVTWDSLETEEQSIILDAIGGIYRLLYKTYKGKKL